MTVEARMLWTLSLFFFLIGVLYWATAHEPTGVTLLMLCSGAAIVLRGLVGVFSRVAPSE